MTCSKCGEQNHNERGCYKEKNGWTYFKDKGKKQIGQTSIESQQSGHTSGSSCYGPEFGAQQPQQSAFQTQINTQQSTAYGPDIGDDEDPVLTSKIISEADTLLAMRKSRMMPPTGSRRIQLTRDVIGVSTLTNLPSSPTKTSWLGREVVT